MRWALGLEVASVCTLKEMWTYFVAWLHLAGPGGPGWTSAFGFGDAKGGG